MKILASQDDLIDALTVIASVTTDKRSQLPILTNTLISSIEDNKIRLIATDTTVFASVYISAKVKESGLLCVCARDLIDRVKKMPESNISLDDNGNIGSTSSLRKHHIPVLNTELFPQVQMPDKSEPCVCISVSKLKELFGKTWFAVSGDNSQPNIHNLYIVFNGTNVQMISFDGYKLAFAEQEFGEKYQTISVPYKAVMFIKRWISKFNKDEQVRIVRNQHGIYFSVGEVIYGFREMNVDPPDYEKIFSMDYSNIVMLEKSELIDSVMSSMLTDDRIVFSFKDTKCTISCIGEDSKYTEDQIKCKIKGDPPKFKINGKFLLDCVNSFSSDKVRFRLGKSNSDPIMLTESGYKTIIAPMVD